MFICTHVWSRITLIRSFTCKLPFLSRYISELLSRHGQGPVCCKSPKLLGPEKPFVKLQPTYSVTLGFLYVVKGMKIKITAKFRASRRLCFDDTKRIMSPTIHPKSFGTFRNRPRETAIVPSLVVAQISMFLVRVVMKLNSYGSWNLFFNYNNKYNGLILR